MPSQHRSTLSSVCLFVTICALAVATPYAVSGAGFTTVNEAVDGPDHCENGNPGVNCNLYDGKQFVWLNGGPAANGLGPDGRYFFAVLEPGGQTDPNDGGAKNLSDDFDSYANRTFTVTSGEVSAYAGTHDSDVPFIRLAPYASTTNPGGVYIMAICSLAKGYPVNPKDCKYDAFKVRDGVARVQAVLSGRKIHDTNGDGVLGVGELGIQGWQIDITCTDGSVGSAETNENGEWTFATLLHSPVSGTTECTVTEVQQPPMSQSGPNDASHVNASPGASAEVVATAMGMGYRVTIPTDKASTVAELHFFNWIDGGGN